LANLHYENLGKVCGSGVTLTPSQQIIQCLLGYGYLRDYLNKALRGFENLVTEIEWERAEPPTESTSSIHLSPRRRVEREIAKLRPERRDWVWVRLKPLESEEGDVVLQEFLDADVVNDRIESRPNRDSLIWVKARDEESGLLALERAPRGPKIFLRPNTYTLRCQINAIEQLQSAPLCHHIPLLRLTEDPATAIWPDVRPGEPDEWALLTDPRRPGAREQRNFVALAMETPDFAILMGPPGSGKTVSICELIVQQVRRGRRVMLCASTHVAVDNVLEVLAERRLTETDVIAVRIGDSRKVSELTRKFQLEERLKTERGELIGKLKAIQQRGPAQDFLLTALQDEDPNDRFLTRLILECSNLVCGTSIGILKHPDIRGSRTGKGDPFDMLIVDEVSKTTLQEFLVPALWAKRWVLVGDTKQLAPFVEEEEVKSNIKSFLDSNSRKACAEVFEAMEPNPAAFLVEEADQVRPLIQQQAEKLGLPSVVLEKPPSETSLEVQLQLMGARVAVATPAVASSWERLIPKDMANLSNLSLDLHRRRQWAHLKRPPRASEEERTWEGQMAWRMTRLFEMRSLPETDSENLRKEVRALLPQWLGEAARMEIQDKLDQLRQMAFPSVLEVLEQGYRGGARSRATGLARGLPRHVLRARRVALTYQHRMHPKISEFPHVHIYEGKHLATPPGMEARRRLPFELYPTRSHWIHVGGQTSGSRNENAAEVDRLMQELDRLRQQTRAHRPNDPEHRDGWWEVAILSFYRPQETAIRQRLRDVFHQPGRRQHFEDPSAHLRVNLATVDRIQGQEADFVFLSFVQTRKVGFLNIPSRLNVALTRARYQLVLLGHHRFFLRQNRSDLLRKLAEAHATPDVSLPRRAV
jgi:hypothetical protein